MCMTTLLSTMGALLNKGSHVCGFTGMLLRQLDYWGFTSKDGPRAHCARSFATGGFQLNAVRRGQHALRLHRTAFDHAAEALQLP